MMISQMTPQKTLAQTQHAQIHHTVIRILILQNKHQIVQTQTVQIHRIVTHTVIQQKPQHMPISDPSYIAQDVLFIPGGW